MSLHLTLDDVHEILRLLDDSPYDELILETGDVKLSLRRSADGGWVEERTAPDSAPTDAGRPSADPAGTTAPAADGLSPVPAALPGTFYRAPKPGAEPFVEIGSTVDEETVVAIIETMKLMNSVTAGCRGEVVEILVANGEMVEAGQALMRVREAGA